MAPNLILHRRSQVPAEESAAFGPVAERFRRAGDLERAVSLCRDGLKRFPHHISARVTLGWALLDLGKYEEAQTELEVVLRRAPDNLAAIRGLAELHDRAEHTMHLPMDGPGQWPPDEAAVNQAAEPVARFEAPAELVEQSSAVVSAPVEYGIADIAEPEPETEASDSDRAVFTVADYESAVWAPVSEPQPTHPQPESVEHPVAIASEQVALVTEEPSPEWAETPAEAAVAAVAAVAADESPTALAEAPLAAAIEEPAVVTAEEAVVAVAEEPTAVEAASVISQVPTASVAEEPPIVSIEEPAVVVTAEPLAAWEAPEPLLEMTAVELEPEVAPYVEEAEKPVVSEADIAALIAEAEKLEAAAEAAAAAEAVELSAEADPDGLADLGLELAPVASSITPITPADLEGPPVSVAEPAQEAPVAVAEPAQEAPVSVAELALEAPVVAAVEPVVREHVAEVISMARAARPDRSAKTVAALEHLLVKVQARRAQVMAESVA